MDMSIKYSKNQTWILLEEVREEGRTVTTSSSGTSCVCFRAGWDVFIPGPTKQRHSPTSFVQEVLESCTKCSPPRGLKCGHWLQGDGHRVFHLSSSCADATELPPWLERTSPVAILSSAPNRSDFSWRLPVCRVKPHCNLQAEKFS